MDIFPRLVHRYQDKHLSARQMEIVARLVAGQDTAAIARAMFLSTSTVRNHLVAVYGKLALRSRAELLSALLRDLAAVDRG